MMGFRKGEGHRGKDKPFGRKNDSIKYLNVKKKYFFKKLLFAVELQRENIWEE